MDKFQITKSKLQTINNIQYQDYKKRKFCKLYIGICNLFVICLLSIVISPVVYAATVTWNGDGADNNWSNV